MTNQLAADTNASIATLAEFFRVFLDETEFKEYRSAERVVANLKLQGNTVSGSPVVRPADCGRAISTLTEIFNNNQFYFRTGDPRHIDRFERLISELAEFCHKTYPSEALGADLLRARIKLFSGNPSAALEIVTRYVERPYLIEGGFEKALLVATVFGESHLQKGTLAKCDVSFVSWGRWLKSIGGGSTANRIAESLAPFVAVSPLDQSSSSVISRWIARLSGRYVRAKRDYNRWHLGARNWLESRICTILIATLFKLLSLQEKNKGPHSAAMDASSGRVLVTRAMGGIGDLLMMSPGLRILAQKTGQPVDFAIPKKFHPLFWNNPSVNLHDIEGPRLDIRAYMSWRNLSICPAGRYESANRPNAKKGRVELFALGMGVKKHEFERDTKKIDYFLSPEQRQFCEDYKKEHALGNRPIIGIQPYSRDSYKDHGKITEIIHSLSQAYDVLIFHHVRDGLPAGERIFSTAGQPLGNSLALVSILDVMVSVDSAFLHAAAAFDVPVVAMFGPTDGALFTQHHKRVKVLWKRQDFPCAPCWRNEDLPCPLTQTKMSLSRQQKEMSPCVNAITVDEVRASVIEMIATARENAAE
ncbi:ADP-heptose:LPS heptosyltransferase (plasmid) [Ensifer sp. WSM1721]|uniref:glycosyltransferase family 9 protein n=1 Tax=Ensifer sp. WSM1721 TaxID=1041159 RepID=UPI0004BBF6A3|nr:glycosyltransferase family 9 protein [Ensifer sp. WSM1721]